jgi:hypothetical protein
MLFRSIIAIAVLAAATTLSAQTNGSLSGARTRNVWQTAAGTAPPASDARDEQPPPRSTARGQATLAVDRGGPVAADRGQPIQGAQALPRGSAAPLQPVNNPTARSPARVTTGGGLPADGGQIWREYDISPYTLRVTSTNRPEQAIIDWILRETGYEMWHSDPVGLLSANARSLRVYHTPEVQQLVADLVDRFVNTEAESEAFSLRVITVDNPNWRAVGHRVMKPVPVETQGVQAWLLEKEDAALLLAELRKRTDFREHSSPHMLVNNGQSTVVAATRPISYVRDIILRPGTWPGFEAEPAQIDEGFSIELNPLLSIDGGTIDAILKCNIDQVERLQEVNMEVPTPAAPRQRTKIEVPQISHCRLHERFHWPVNQVLLVGLGVVATPVPTDKNPNLLAMALSMPQAPPRADLLVFVEAKGKAGHAPSTTARTRTEAQSYRGRY